MDAVVKRILDVQETDGSSRFLIFSTWNDVLDVVEHSFTANNIEFIRAKGRRYSQFKPSPDHFERSIFMPIIYTCVFVI